MFSRNKNQIHFIGIEISFISFWISLFWCIVASGCYCTDLQRYWALKKPNSSIFISNLTNIWTPCIIHFLHSENSYQRMEAYWRYRGCGRWENYESNWNISTKWGMDEISLLFSSTQRFDFVFFFNHRFCLLSNPTLTNLDQTKKTKNSIASTESVLCRTS